MRNTLGLHPFFGEWTSVLFFTMESREVLVYCNSRRKSNTQIFLNFLAWKRSISKTERDFNSFSVRLKMLSVSSYWLKIHGGKVLSFRWSGSPFEDWLAQVWRVRMHSWFVRNSRHCMFPHTERHPLRQMNGSLVKNTGREHGFDEGRTHIRNMISIRRWLKRFSTYSLTSRRPLLRFTAYPYFFEALIWPSVLSNLLHWWKMALKSIQFVLSPNASLTSSSDLIGSLVGHLTIGNRSIFVGNGKWDTEL